MVDFVYIRSPDANANNLSDAFLSD